MKVNDYLVCVGANSQNLFRFIKKELGDHVPIEEFEKEATQEYIERTNRLPAMEGVKELIIRMRNILV